MAARALSDGEARLLAQLPENAQAAQALLRERGLPGRRHEQWKWSDLRAAFDENVQFAVRAEVDRPTAEQAAARGDFIAMLAGAFGDTDSLKVGADERAVRVHRLRGGNLRPTALTVDLAPGAALTRVVIQEGQSGVALDSVRVRLGAGATYRHRQVLRLDTVDAAG